jgi:hypothetical protein
MLNLDMCGKCFVAATKRRGSIGIPGPHLGMWACAALVDANPGTSIDVVGVTEESVPPPICYHRLEQAMLVGMGNKDVI